MKKSNPALKPIETKPLLDGTQALYRFDNGYGASVVQHNASYGGSEGLWELAVIAWDADGDYTEVYDTPVTRDVLGWLGEGQVAETLQRIEVLPGRGSEAGR